MEGVYEELDEAKAEIEKLREECKRKTEQSESLKRSHNEHLAKSQEANSKIEKQAREINEKSEEILTLKQTIDDLRRSLNEKDSTLKRLTAANEKLRVDCDLKVKKLEEEARILVSTLEEVNGRSFDQEHRIHALEEEINGLKRSLSASQKKCSEAEAKANRSKEAREKDDTILDLEERKRKTEEQLKWKKEQFTHLEEAHRKMRDQFSKTEKEWESEKSSLLDEICSLQTSLDSQTRISEDLQSRLGICNQALAREESRRKSLQVQLSEVQNRFENIFSDYEEAKSQLEGLTEKRDEEIACLRHSLSKKETVLKEMEYQKRLAKQENEEIRVSLKEFQESQIQTPKAPASASVAKLQNKVRSLELMNKESTENLKAKEVEMNEKLSELERKEQTINDLRMEMKELHEKIAKLNAKGSEINSELEKVKGGLVNYKSELESRDVIIEELRMALEQIHSESTANFQARETEWKSRVDLITEDLRKCRSQLEKDDEVIAGLNEELGNLRVENFERNSQLEKVSTDLNNLWSLLEGRDATVRELKIELEQIYGDSDSNSVSRLENREAELILQVKKMKEDLEKYKFQLEKKDQALKELKKESEQNREDYSVNIAAIEAKGISELETVRKELMNYKSKLENGEAIIRALRSELEEIRRDFGLNLQSKEAEWEDRFETMKSVIDEKDERVKATKYQNEELSMTLLVLKNGISEAQLKIDTEKLEMDRSENEKEAMKNAEIVRLLKRVESLETDDHEKHLQMQRELGSYEEMLMESSIAELFIREQLLQNQSVLRKKLDDEEARVKKLELAMEDCNSSSSVMLMDLKNAISEKEEIVSELSQKLENYEEMLMESSIRELFVREQLLQNERVLREKLKLVSAELERANSELAEKIGEENRLEFELYIWKSVAERFRVDLEEGFEVRKELEASLLAQVISGETIEQGQKRLFSVVEEKDRTIDDLQKHVSLLEQEFEDKNLLIGKLSSEKENILGFMGKLDDSISEFSKSDNCLMNMLENMTISDLSEAEKENEEILMAAKKLAPSNNGVRSPFREINELER